MKKITRVIEKLLSIPKSLYVNLRLLPFRQAIRMPIMVRYNTALRDLSGRVKITNTRGVETGMLRFGFSGVPAFDWKYERSSLNIAGVIELNGRAKIGHGSRICVGKHGVLTIGHKFLNSCGLTIICENNIQLGENAQTSWQVILMDTDFHHVKDLETGKLHPYERPIVIAKDVWIGMRAVILKGAEIAEGCIVGSNSVINKKFKTPYTIIAGNPASERKTGVMRAYELESWSNQD